MNLNVTEFVNATSSMNPSELIEYTSYKIFLVPVFACWLLVFVLTLIIGLATVKKDKENFWSIFIFTQLILFILLTFTFVFPIIPQLLDSMGIISFSGG